MRTRADFLKKRINTEALSPQIYDGILKAMEDWGKHLLAEKQESLIETFDIDNAKIVLCYLNECAGTDFKMHNKSAIKIIVSKFHQKYTVDDLKQVIFVKTQKWLGTEYECYLRPETLFGSKFDSYRNESLIVKKSKTQINYDTVISATEIGWSNKPTNP